MQRYKIVAHISLILSVLNLVLAAPIVVRGIHEAYGDEMVVAANVAAMPKKWRELEDRQTSPQTSPDAVADAADRPTSPPTSLDAAAAAPDRQTSLQSSPDTIVEASDRQTSPKTSPDAGADAPDRQTSLQSSPDTIAEASDRQTSPQLSPDAGATTPPQHSSSSSLDGLDYPTPALSSAPSRSAEDYSWMLDRLRQSPNLNDESGSSEIAPPSPPPALLPGSDSDSSYEYLTDNVRLEPSGVSTKLKIVAGVIIVGSGIIGGIVGSQVKHHKHREIQDS